jgi:phosphatidylserine decarboxylase
MSDRLAVLPQYLLPKQALTQLAGALARAQAGGLTTAVIRWFVGRYGVNMAEAAEPDIARYASFNDFFTRPLKPGARPLAAARLICPVDGAISQFGRIERDQIFQAKGHQYSTQALVGGDAALAAEFQDGSFATLYLSPRDYHRIHMPCEGRLRRMIHVPGELFSVNPTTARGVPGLFARNERVVCVFDSAAGPFVLVLVGATIVRMADLFDNPMGLMGFEFVEFASPTAQPAGAAVRADGLHAGGAKHRSKDVLLYRQGDINFIVNREPAASPATSPPSTGRRPAGWLSG